MPIAFSVSACRFIHSAWNISGWQFARHHSSVIRIVWSTSGCKPKLSKCEFRLAFPLRWLGARKVHSAWRISAMADCCAWADTLHCMARRQHLGIQHLASSGSKAEHVPTYITVSLHGFPTRCQLLGAKVLPKMAYKFLDHTEVLYGVWMRLFLLEWQEWPWDKSKHFQYSDFKWHYAFRKDFPLFLNFVSSPMKKITKDGMSPEHTDVSRWMPIPTDTPDVINF